MIEPSAFEIPLISPRQMNFLRALAAMAWVDGVLEPAEVATMSEQLVSLFRQDHDMTAELCAQVRAFVQQNIPLSETLPRVSDPQDRELLLKLAYLVIHVSRRTSDEPLVNEKEAGAYQNLVVQLDFNPETVRRLEQEASELSLEATLSEVSRVCQE
ncbi:MAG: TerB family tellurite resistance protein [Gemmatimonadaceae bacterium]|nr:TerB family tellurite resistance protein [Gloeobacterales cyanobacterium ES-bin-141]